MRVTARTSLKVNRQLRPQLHGVNSRALLELGKAIVARTHYPRSAGPGPHVADTGTVVVYQDGREVAREGTAMRPSSPPENGMVVGFGFPSRFLEGGTVHMAARPALVPATDEVATSERYQQLLEQEAPRG